MGRLAMLSTDRLFKCFKYLFFGLAVVYGVYWILATFFFRDWYMSKPLDALFFVFCAGYSLLHEKADRLHKIVWTSIMLLLGLLALLV